MYRLVDTHAHLDEVPDVYAMVDEAREAGVMAVVAVGSGRESNARTLEIAQEYRGCVYPALGLHPWELGSLGAAGVDADLRFVDENITSAVAAGEIGLDYDKRVLKLASKELQKEVLVQLLGIARRHRKPVIIHSRYAWKDALQAVRDAGIEKAVFHWFTGFSSVLREIIEHGYFISATPATEYHEEHRRAVKEAPLHRLLLETDCPVTYGREHRYRSRPADVVRDLKAVSQLKGVDEATVANETTRNAVGFFSLDLAF